MQVKHFFKIRYVLFLLLLFYLISPVSRADSTDDISWQQLETQTTVIKYQTGENLKKFNSKIKFGRSRWGLKSIVGTEEPDTLHERIIHKIDAMYARVQEILDMQKAMEKVTIYLYDDREQLNKAYFDLYQSECHIRAWYIYEYNAIYINVHDLHEGMLAHEMAHAIIDHFLTVRPPPASAEILARYVDSHLHDE